MKQKQLFWDIESYDNFFCVGLYDDDNNLEMHYLVENAEDALAVKRACEDSGLKHKLYNIESGLTYYRYYRAVFSFFLPKTIS